MRKEDILSFRGFYLEECLTCEELVGLFTGDDGLSSNVVKMIYGSKVDISNLQNST